MKVLAIDFGHKRLGTAIGDTADGVAFPRAIIAHDHLALDHLVTLIEAEAVQQVLVGLPLTLAGDLSRLARDAAAFADQLEDKLLSLNKKIPVDFADERWSSKTGREAALQHGLSQRQSRGKVDAAAAAVFLQAWFDRKCF